MQTNRLIIRRYRREDFEDFFEYISDAEVLKYEPYEPLGLEEAKWDMSCRMGSNAFFALEERSTGKMIGNIYLDAREFSAMEMGVVLNKAYWRLGYATEACRALVDFAFAQGAHRIYAECDPENTACCRLLEGLGFHRDGLMRQNVYFFKDEDGRPIWRDTCIYTLLESNAQ